MNKNIVWFYFVKIIKMFKKLFWKIFWNVKPQEDKSNYDDSWTRYKKREENAGKRIIEKNIVLWDYVICTRERDWIYQWKWKFTWEIQKQYEYKNIRYYVEFERNWMKRIFPISIDKIEKVQKKSFNSKK